MRNLIATISFLTMFVQSTIWQRKADILTAEQATNFIGHDVVIKARVVNVYNGVDLKGQPFYLNLDKKFPDNPVVVLY